MFEIAESDWRIIRGLKPLVLERYCQRVLTEVATQATSTGGDAQARYHVVWALLRNRDDEIALAFDGLNRSTAPFKVATMRRLGMLTDEEFARVSPSLREWVQQALSVTDSRKR